MWEPVALCCFSRRTGCLVLGYLERVGACFLLGTSVHLLTIKEINHISACGHRYMAGVEHCEETIQQYADVTVNTIAAILMSFGVVQLVCSSMMIHGVRTNAHCLMCPFLIKNTIFVAIHIILAGIFVLFMIVFNFVVAIFAAKCCGALIFMETYFLLTVRAYYYEVKRGKADDHHKLVEN